MTTGLEPVRSVSESGWLSTDQAAAYLTNIFGHKVSKRSIQSWCHRAHNPLPHAQLGGRGRLLVHKTDLDKWLGIAGREVPR